MDQDEIKEAIMDCESRENKGHLKDWGESKSSGEGDLSYSSNIKSIEYANQPSGMGHSANKDVFRVIPLTGASIANDPTAKDYEEKARQEIQDAFKINKKTPEIKEEVMHPKHYWKFEGVKEAIDIADIVGNSLAKADVPPNAYFCIITALIYLLRCGDKDEWKKEVKKTIWYLQRSLGENKL